MQEMLGRLAGLAVLNGVRDYRGGVRHLRAPARRLLTRILHSLRAHRAVRLALTVLRLSRIRCLGDARQLVTVDAEVRQLHNRRALATSASD